MNRIKPTKKSEWSNEFIKERTNEVKTIEQIIEWKCEQTSEQTKNINKKNNERKRMSK